MLTTIYYEREGDINGEKRKPRRQVKKRPATPHGAGYLFYHSGNCGGLPGFQHSDVPKVLGYGGLALGGVLLNVLLCTASVELSHIAAYGTLYQCKINYVSHITKLPLDYHLKMGSGKLRKVMDDNIESLEGFIAHDLPNMISAFVAPVVMLVLVFIVDWRFGLATFVGIIVSFLMYGVTSGGNKTKKLMEDYQTSLEDMSNASVEYI